MHGEEGRLCDTAELDVSFINKDRISVEAVIIVT